MENNIPNYIEYGEKARGAITDYFSIQPIKKIMEAHSVHEPHCHTLLYQVTWITEGDYFLEVDGRKYHLQKNNLLLLRPNTVHATKFSDSLGGFVMHFSQDFFYLDTTRDRHFSRIIKNNLSDGLVLVALDDSSATEIDEVCNRMVQTYVGASFLKNEILRSYLNVVLLKMYEFYGLREKNTLYSSSETLINRFLQALEEHFIDKRGVNDYADILNISSGYLNSIVKKETRKTAGELIREKLIIEAKRLLIYSEKDISEISYELNFSDASYFWRLFKKQTQCTPKQFREKHR